jgi:hypothetical protein
MNNYDVIIFGCGAGGGPLALKLAPSGKKILILERSVFFFAQGHCGANHFSGVSRICLIARFFQPSATGTMLNCCSPALEMTKVPHCLTR